MPKPDGGQRDLQYIFYPLTKNNDRNIVKSNK